MDVVAGGYLDIGAMKRRLTRHHKERAQERLAALRRGAAAEAEAVARKYREEKTAEQVGRGRSPEEADRIVRRRMGWVLDAADTLTLEDGRTVSVADVLANVDDFDGVAVCDPLVPEKGAGKAKIFARPAAYEGPVIWSFAEGGRLFYLGRHWPKRRKGRRRVTLERWGKPLPPLVKPIPIDELRAEQRAFIRDAVNRSGVIATVVATMGSGKSRMAFEEIIARNEADRKKNRTVRRTLVLLGQHAMIEEKVREFRQLAGGTSVTCHGYAGRVRPEADAAEKASLPKSPCLRPQIVHDATRAGYTAIKGGFCTRELSEKEMIARATDERLVQCPHWQECHERGSREVANYYWGVDQSANAEVVFASHVFVETWAGDIGDFDTIVIDESVLGEILDEKGYRVARLVREAERCEGEDRADLLAVLDDLQAEAAGRGRPKRPWSGGSAPSSPQKSACARLPSTLPSRATAPSSTPRWPRMPFAPSSVASAATLGRPSCGRSPTSSGMITRLFTESGSIPGPRTTRPRSSREQDAPVGPAGAGTEGRRRRSVPRRHHDGAHRRARDRGAVGRHRHEPCRDLVLRAACGVQHPPNCGHRQNHEPPADGR